MDKIEEIFGNIVNNNSETPVETTNVNNNEEQVVNTEVKADAEPFREIEEQIWKDIIIHFSCNTNR